jgi:hypothetical protein
MAPIFARTFILRAALLLLHSMRHRIDAWNVQCGHAVKFVSPPMILQCTLLWAFHRKTLRALRGTEYVELVQYKQGNAANCWYDPY